MSELCSREGEKEASNADLDSRDGDVWPRAVVKQKDNGHDDAHHDSIFQAKQERSEERKQIRGHIDSLNADEAPMSLGKCENKIIRTFSETTERPPFL